MSWQVSEAHHGASLLYLMVLQAVNFLHNTSPSEFSSIPFITAPTRLDSNSFCPHCNCTALQSHLSTSCLLAWGGKEQYFHPMKNQSSLLIQKATLSSPSHSSLLFQFLGLFDCVLLGQAPGRSLQSLLWLFLFSLYGSPLLPPHHQSLLASALHLVPFLQAHTLILLMLS